MPVIISGITGGIGHGKTTFANLLAQQSQATVHFESWELVAEVANALRQESPQHPAADDIDGINKWLQPLADLVQLHTHCSVIFEQLKLTATQLADHPEYFDKLLEYLQAVQADSQLADADITQANKEQFRALLQWLGGYLVVVGGGGIWYDEIVRRITHLRSSGTELVTVGGVRYPGDAERLRNAGGVILEIKRPSLPDQDALDLTERDRNLIQADSVIINNGSLDQLSSHAVIMYEDLRLRQLHPEYRVIA